MMRLNIHEHDHLLQIALYENDTLINVFRHGGNYQQQTEDEWAAFLLPLLAWNGHVFFEIEKVDVALNDELYQNASRFFKKYLNNNVNIIRHQIRS